MRKRTLPKAFLTLFFLAILGLAFYIMWTHEFNLITQRGANKKTEQEIKPVYSLAPLAVMLSGKYLKVTQEEDEIKPKLGFGKKYLGIAIDLELKNEEIIGELDKQLPQIRAAISDIASAKTVKDIETPEGKAAMGHEIVQGVNNILQKEGVNKALFKEFIIQ